MNKNSRWGIIAEGAGGVNWYRQGVFGGLEGRQGRIAGSALKRARKWRIELAKNVLRWVICRGYSERTSAKSAKKLEKVGSFGGQSGVF